MSDLKTRNGAFSRWSRSRRCGPGLRRLAPGDLKALPSDRTWFDGNFLAGRERRLLEIGYFGSSRVSLYDTYGLVDAWDCLPELLVATKPVTHRRDEWAGILNIPSRFSLLPLEVEAH